MAATESNALWRIYTGKGGGVALQTTYAKLKQALTPQYSICAIRYIDYDADDVDALNVLSHVGCKRKVFAYEHEVRIFRAFYQPDEILTITETSNGKAGAFREDWAERMPTGLEMQFDPNKFIEKIIVSPYTPEWYVDVIKSVMLKFEIAVPIERSQMLGTPLFDDCDYDTNAVFSDRIRTALR
jgi:hypothetical protein